VLVEQARVMARLVDAGRATPDARSRASAELAEAEQRAAEAEQLASASGQAFNLLLGRELDAPVDLVDPAALGLDALPSLDETLRSGLGRREELRALEAGGRAALAQQAIASAGYLPNLAVAVDYGIQGNDYRFTQETDFALVSVVASWNLFNGGRDRARVEQARLDAARITLRGDEVRRGVELQIRTAWQAAAVARQAIETAEVQREAAERTWQLVRRRAEEGLASALELSEARAGRTAAQINALFTTYDFYLRRVELDRAAALYPRTSP
jgi:outer membrane protein TolC